MLAVLMDRPNIVQTLVCVAKNKLLPEQFRLFLNAMDVNVATAWNHACDKACNEIVKMLKTYYLKGE